MAFALANSYVGESLLNGFNWVNTPDLSNGFVRYQSQADAASRGLFAVDQQTGVVRLGVDSTNQYSLGEGRPSIRIESKEAYNHGLFIADFLHMPPSQCGVWPAFWAYGPDWPSSGELDIIEGANTAHQNLISAHTGPGCRVDQQTANMASGRAQTTDCDVGDQNIGCGFVPGTDDTATYGDTFNAVNGGVYAMNWDSKYIKVWHFERSKIPSDITSKKPNPDGWGKPDAVFGGSSCDVDNYFKDMSIVININFCGDYGNAVWNNDGCNALAPTCNEWVANNPAAFANAYWDINFIDAYVQTPDGESPGESSPPFIPAPQPSASSNGSSAPKSKSPMPTFGNSTNTERTTTTTMTSHTSTTTVTVPVPTADLPSPSKLPSNPANINDYSYLGCFGSSDDFKPFTKTGEADNMTLEKCIKMCEGDKYAGVFDTGCYCADKLSANTRATGSDQMCDMACPGNNKQFCGGLVKGSLDDSVGAMANITTPETSSASADANKPKKSGDSSKADNTTTSSMPPMRNTTLPLNSTMPAKNSTIAARAMLWNKKRAFESREAAGHLLSIYAAVAAEEPPKPAPAMGSGLASSKTKPVSSTTVVTTITYKTVYPLKPSEVVNAKFVTTFVTEDCGCTDKPQVPMTTTVVKCAACGPSGEDKVTLTVPHSPNVPVQHTVEKSTMAPSMATQVTMNTASMNTPSMPTHTANPAPSQVLVSGDASALKIGSTLAFAMLAMAAML